MAPLFTIIFVSKLVSNVLKNFRAIPWHQKPTMGRGVYPTGSDGPGQDRGLDLIKSSDYHT